METKVQDTTLNLEQLESRLEMEMIAAAWPDCGDGSTGTGDCPGGNTTPVCTCWF